MDQYIIERTQDEGRTEQYLNGRTWVADRASAERMTYEEAEQLANDWQDFCAMKGSPAWFNLAQVKGE